MIAKTAALISLTFLLSCSTDIMPNTPGEDASGFDYVPVDPLPVAMMPNGTCPRSTRSTASILSSLPDNSVRIATRQIDGSGSATYGPARVGAEGHQYQVILDYINADVVNARFRVTTLQTTQPNSRTTQTVVVSVKRIPLSEEMNSGDAQLSPNVRVRDIVIPVYVGIGLRLTATVSVLRGQVNLGNLGALAAQAEAGNVTGSMVVQTLGITGRQVATSLPMPSELNQTTIQNAILSLGAIKAVVYDAENTIVRPRVTGIYNPLGASGTRIVNLIVSELARERVEWQPPCPIAS